MKVFFDIITNHTADVIDYAGRPAHLHLARRPALQGRRRQRLRRPRLRRRSPSRRMDPATSFPYTPVFRTAADATAKVPAWLNDPTMYHNRGDSTFAGESSTYGDFVRPRRPVHRAARGRARAWSDIYKTWVDFGIDGFRIDTVKHVNIEFWQKFCPAILGRGQADGQERRLLHVRRGLRRQPGRACRSTRPTGKLPATLDFGFQAAGASTSPRASRTDVLRDFFAERRLLHRHRLQRLPAADLPRQPRHGPRRRCSSRPTAQSEAEHLRAGQARQLADVPHPRPARSSTTATSRASSAPAATRTPARTCSPARSTLYNDRARPRRARRAARTATTPRRRCTSTSPSSRRCAPRTRRSPTARRSTATPPTAPASSRLSAGIDSQGGPTRTVEYVVAANNATTAEDGDLRRPGPRARRGFTPLYGTDTAVKPAADGSVKVTVPPLTVSVWKANKPIATRRCGTDRRDRRSPSGGAYGGAPRSGPTCTASTFAQVTFLWRQVGTTKWKTLGTDDNAPYRVFHDVSGIAKGTLLEYRAIVKDAAGHVAGDSSYAQSSVEPPTQTGAGARSAPVTQPDAVAVAGHAQLRDGLPRAATGHPDCARPSWPWTPTTRSGRGPTPSRPGRTPTRPRSTRRGTENYGEGGVRTAATSTTRRPAARSPSTTTTPRTGSPRDAQGPIITAPGSFQSELGCPADWDPACMRPWLQDPDGDGVYALVTTKIPAGTLRVQGRARAVLRRELPRRTTSA